MKTNQQTKPAKAGKNAPLNKKAGNKSTAAAAKSMDMPTATSKARARNGRSLPNEGTINSYEEDVSSAS